MPSRRCLRISFSYYITFSIRLIRVSLHVPLGLHPQGGTKGDAGHTVPQTATIKAHRLNPPPGPTSTRPPSPLRTFPPQRYCWRTPTLTPQRLRRFARFFRVGAGWAARGRPTSPNTKEKTSRAAVSSLRKGFASGIRRDGESSEFPLDL